MLHLPVFCFRLVCLDRCRCARSNIRTDLADGVFLCELLQRLLKDSSIRPPHPQPMLVSNRLANINYAIRVCEHNGVFGNEGFSSAQAAGIRADDILHGRLDGTLNLIYRLISHFDIVHTPLVRATATPNKRPVPPASDIILSWVRSFDDVAELQDVMDLTQAWRSGRALYALVARVTNMASRTPPVKVQFSKDTNNNNNESKNMGHTSSTRYMLVVFFMFARARARVCARVCVWVLVNCKGHHFVAFPPLPF